MTSDTLMKQYPVPKVLIGKLLMLTVFFSISYVHLPLVNIHHSMGSLFNLPLFLLVVLCGLNFLFGANCHRSLVIFFMLYLVGTNFVLLGSFFSNAGLINSTSDNQFKLFVSALSGLWLPVVVVVVGYAIDSTGYSLDDIHGHIQIPTYVLLGYLTFEYVALNTSLPIFPMIYKSILPLLQYRVDFVSFGGRLRGFSNEPSYLAVVLIFLTTIHLLAYIRGKKAALYQVFLLSTMGVVSLSKNFLGALAILLLLTILMKKEAAKYLIPMIFTMGTIFMFYLSNNEGIMWQYEAYGIDFSTLTRVGSWHAAISGFLDSPFFGWGPGSAGYLLDKYYPDYFFLSIEAEDWLDKKAVFGIPVFNYLFKNMFEYGLIGLMLLICLVIQGAKSSSSKIFTRENVLIITAFFLVLNMTDGFTFWPFVILLFAKRNRDTSLNSFYNNFYSKLAGNAR